VRTQLRASGAHTGVRYGSFAGRDASRDVDSLTQARSHGAHTGPRYGSFEGRGGGGSHPVAALTQAHSHGAHTGPRYGSFEGRGIVSGHPVDALTQACNHGAHTGRRYGDFSGRTPSVEPPVIHPPSGTPFVMRLPSHDWLEEEQMWLLLIAQMIASGQIH